MSRLLVIGCGRSGTMFLTRLLYYSGCRVGHEQITEAGGVGWQLTLPHWREKWRDDDRIVHLIREPWSCISSLTTHDLEVYERAESIVGHWSDIGERLRTAAEWWVRHNDLCDQ